MPCRSRRPARSTAARSPRPRRRRRPRPARGCRRGPRPRRSSRASGPTCSACRASGFTTTSSSWAATRSCRSRSSRAPRQIFQHQTVAELAAVAGTLAAVEAEQGAVVGTAPLLPIQAWFFAGDRPDRHWFNQSFLLSVDRQLEPAALDLALDRLLEHHDALRLRFRPEAAGWVQDFTPPAMAATSAEGET